jgi:Cu(I)/Ag(I) efflux system membrane protein CusA/SilA
MLGVTAVRPMTRIGSEFMPTLNEGTLLYMPATLPGMSVTKAAELLQQQDRIIKSFPEVESVFGKAGRASQRHRSGAARDVRDVINLKPEQWRPGMTMDGKLIAELDKALQFPGVANAWTMPIKGRIDMLSTGIRTPIGSRYSARTWRAGAPRTRDRGVVKTVPARPAPTPSVSPAATTSTIEPDALAARPATGCRSTRCRKPSPARSAAKWSPRRSEGRERFSVRSCATRANCAPIPMPSLATCWCRAHRTARWCRSDRSRNGAHRRGRPPSAPRTRCFRPISLSTSADRDIGGYVERAQRAVPSR